MLVRLLVGNARPRTSKPRRRCATSNNNIKNLLFLSSSTMLVTVLILILISISIFGSSVCSFCEAFGFVHHGHSVRRIQATTESQLFMTAKVDQKNDHHTSSMARTRHMITTIDSKQQFQQFLQQDDRLTIIKFHAAWCKSCQKFGMQFASLARHLADEVDVDTNQVLKQGTMRLGEIEHASNLGLCRELQIKRLPTVHFYSQGQLVDAFPCGPKKLPLLLEKIEHYQALSLQELQFEAEMFKGNQLLANEISLDNASNKSATNGDNHVDDQYENKTIDEKLDMLNARIEQLLSSSSSSPPAENSNDKPATVAGSAQKKKHFFGLF